MKNEPNPMPHRETSKLLSILFKALRDEGITKDRIARELCLYAHDIDSLIFNLTIIGINGGSETTRKEHIKRNNNNYLRIVK